MYYPYTTGGGKGVGSRVAPFEAETLSRIMMVCLIIAIIGALVLFFTFMGKKNEGKFHGFLGWMYEFLHFKKLLAESVLKVLYLITAADFTLSALAFLIFGNGFEFSVRIGVFFILLILGNVLTRLVYEFALVVLIICRNTTEINKKMDGQRNSGLPQQPGADNFAAKPPETPGVVFCRNCGNSFSAQETVCPHCGRIRE